MRKVRWGLLAAAVVALAGATQVGAMTNVSSSAAAKPQVTIGISLPLTGRFSEPGQAAQRGYQLWAAMMNKRGGLLGRKIQLKIRDDASDQNTIVSDYNRLISEDHVDLLLGTFSSFLNLPASTVAERNHKVFVAPAGGSPALFARHYHFYFFAQQATAPHQGDLFSGWIKSLPPSKRPTKVAYPTLNDPFAKPVSDGIKSKLEGAGFQTVYSKVYPTDTTDFDTIASAIKASGADVIVNGATFADGVGLIRSLIRVGFSPRVMFQTTAPTETAEYAAAIGKQNANGIMYAISWAGSAKGPKFPLNQDFKKAYQKRFHEPPAEDAADAFASAQVLMAAVKGVGKIDQDKMADWLHSHPVRTILGPLGWDQDGAPRGSFFLGQWQRGAPQILRPKIIATTKKVLFPKPAWR
jgi:branched-chain amino acid transport system substrate-binding protein